MKYYKEETNLKENIKINKIITAIGDPQKSKLLNERKLNEAK